MRWRQAWRETGTFEAKPCGGSCSPLDDYEEEIYPGGGTDDRTLDEIVAAMRNLRYPEAARRCVVFWSVAALRTKKVLHASEQEREDVARALSALDTRARAARSSTHLVFSSMRRR